MLEADPPVEFAVPVTVKFSKDFYERFGHEVVDELVDWFNQVDATYRSDLRELNELNFARFDAKVEQRFAEADAKLEKHFAAAEVKLEKRFAAFELNIKERLGEIDTRIADLRTDFFRWSIGLFIAMAGLIVGLFKLFG